jgi:DNA-binding transcriptional ArsR family regulator
MLKDGDMTAGDIAERFDMTKPSISHHLDLLKQADLVASVKKGQFIYYSLNMTVMDEIFAWFIQFRPVSAEKPRIRLQVNPRSITD